MPDIPPISDSGVTDMEINSWVALFAPAGTPDQIVDKLNEETNKILEKPEIQKRHTELGADVNLWSPEEVADFVKSQTEGWAKIIEETGEGGNRSGAPTHCNARSAG